MKIAIICSSLEEGRDGVGDYSRYLAMECIRQGHTPALIALNDRHCSTQSLTTIEERGVSVPVLRLPSTEDWTARRREAEKLLEKFNPDWVSLQFVCYGFNPKGIVAGQIRHFKALRQSWPDVRTHIMLHELWIVETPTLPLRQRLVAAIQRYFILRLLSAWSPTVVHTSNEIYRLRMVATGYRDVKVLPLFGNVPVVASPEEDWLFSALQKAGLTGFSKLSRQEYLICGLFGTLRPPWSPEPVLSYLIQAAERMGRKLVLLSAGRIGARGQAIWEEMQAVYSDRITFLNIGELSAERVSEYLTFLDLGIAATSKKDIGKSGTAAAMLDHGIPIIINRVDDSNLVFWDDRSRTLLHVMDETLPEQIASGFPRLAPASSLITVTQQFLNALK